MVSCYIAVSLFFFLIRSLIRWHFAFFRYIFKDFFLIFLKVLQIIFWFIFYFVLYFIKGFCWIFYKTGVLSGLKRIIWVSSYLIFVAACISVGIYSIPIQKLFFSELVIFSISDKPRLLLKSFYNYVSILLVEEVRFYFKLIYFVLGEKKFVIFKMLY
jgi:hypothetical protein